MASRDRANSHFRIANITDTTRAGTRLPDTERYVKVFLHLLYVLPQRCGTLSGLVLTL